MVKCTACVNKVGKDGVWYCSKIGKYLIRQDVEADEPCERFKGDEQFAGR